MAANRQIRLRARPVGLPKPTDWQLTEEPVPEPGDGELVVQVRYLSLDPAMRGWMNDAKSYIPPVGLGEVMRAIGAGRVIASKHPGFAVGDHVTGIFGAQEYAKSNGVGIAKVDPTVVPLPTWIGTLGMPGMTAYFGLFEVGKPQPGQTVVVSAAAGAVGSIVAQLAKLHGCRAVGIAGGPDKCKYLVDTLGVDAAIDYKHEDVGAALRKACPNGIDVYFDNVGGDILDAALANLARGARVVICGAVSQYNATGAWKGPANYMSLLVNRATMMGMVVSDYFAKWPEAARTMAGWILAGKLKSREDVVPGGITAFHDTLLKLFKGENAGKLVLEL